jgi:transcriptional regulator with XRE-family HTH domain
MSVSAIRSRQRRARRARHNATPVVLTHRMVRQTDRDTRVLYPDAVATPRIDRDAWASLVATLIEQESGGNQTQFGAAVGVDRKTVARWLAGTVDVSEEKVRSVARALGLAARDLLVQVGYYSADELLTDETATKTSPDDPIDLVRNSDLSLSAKRELIEYLIEQRNRQLEETKRLIDLARGRRRAG